MNKAQFTAYALGQLSEAERHEVEKQMDREEAKRMVRDAERLGQALRAERSSEPLPEASATLRAALDERFALVPVRNNASFFRRVAVPLALAASVLVNIVALSYWYTEQGQVAHQSGLLPLGEGGRRPDEGAAGATSVPASPSPVSVAATETPSPGGRGVTGEQLPSAFWQTDDKQFFPPGTEFRLDRAAADKLVRRAGGQGRGETLELQSSADAPLAGAANRKRDGVAVRATIQPARMETTTESTAIPWDQNAAPMLKEQLGLPASGENSYTGGTNITLSGSIALSPSNAPATSAPHSDRTRRQSPGGVFIDRSGALVKSGAGTIAMQNGGPLAVDALRSTPQPHFGPADEIAKLFGFQAGSAGKVLNTEAYDAIVENPFVRVADQPLSTFSIDVDTASYSNMRRFLMQGQLPPAGAVRIEELINYFTYDYPQPTDDRPFSVAADVAACPWNATHRLVRIGLKGREIDRDNRPPSNLVFLIDVSGSMQPENKLPLVKRALQMLVEQLGERDHVAIVVYAGAAGLVLPSTTGNEHKTVLGAIDRLEAGGSTNGASGLQLAYDTARQGFIKGGTNRVILCTDGDFNVGITSQDELVRLIETEAKSDVFLSALGFGMGNYKDSTLEKLADKGNGNYGYIDNEREARKLFVEQMTGTLVTIAKDVKIQIEFNPSRVGAFRLLGYENRILAHEDFNNDKKDAGEIGAGHSVTALYELVPVGENVGLPGVDPLKYQAKSTATNIVEQQLFPLMVEEQLLVETFGPDHPKVKVVRKQIKVLEDLVKRGIPVATADTTNELLTVKLRYKEPEADKSQLIEKPLVDATKPWTAMSADFKFASAVAAFGMLLRGSEHAGTATYATAPEWATEGKGADLQGYRAEFIDLVQRAQSLKLE